MERFPIRRAWHTRSMLVNTENYEHCEKRKCAAVLNLIDFQRVYREVIGNSSYISKGLIFFEYLSLCIMLQIKFISRNVTIAQVDFQLL